MAKFSVELSSGDILDITVPDSASDAMVIEAAKKELQQGERIIGITEEGASTGASSSSSSASPEEILPAGGSATSVGMRQPRPTSMRQMPSSELMDYYGTDKRSSSLYPSLFPRAASAIAQGSEYPVVPAALDMMSLPGRMAMSALDSTYNTAMLPDEMGKQGMGWFKQTLTQPETIAPIPKVTSLGFLGKYIQDAPSLMRTASQGVSKGLGMGASAASVQAMDDRYGDAAASLVASPVLTSISGALAKGLKDKATKMLQTWYMTKYKVEIPEEGARYLLSKVPAVGSTAKSVERGQAKLLNSEIPLSTKYTDLDAERAFYLDQVPKDAEGTIARKTLDALQELRKANKLSLGEEAKGAERLKEFVADYRDLMARGETTTRQDLSRFAERYKDVPSLQKAIAEVLQLSPRYRAGLDYLGNPAKRLDVNLFQPLRTAGSAWTPEMAQRAGMLAGMGNTIGAARAAGMAPSYLSDLAQDKPFWQR